MNSRDRLLEMAEQTSIYITEDEAALLTEYMDQVLAINEHLNLTRITEVDEFLEKHILDSLLLAKEIPEDSTVIDVGTGGGFPGVPIAICRPDVEVTLLDATAKKLKVVGEIVQGMNLPNVEILVGRAESFGGEARYREKYDVVVSRAVANLAVLSEICLPLIKAGGYFLSLKGKNYEEEITEAKGKISRLGGTIEFVNSTFLLQRDVVHVIIAIAKLNQTPKKYPRNFGQIKKNPLG